MDIGIRIIKQPHNIMDTSHIKVRANRATGELEVEGPPAVVADWWERIWPELNVAAAAPAALPPRQLPAASAARSSVPDVFGEFFSEFRSDITDVDKMLIAGSFVQAKDPDRVFTTKAAS